MCINILLLCIKYMLMNNITHTYTCLFIMGPFSGPQNVYRTPATSSCWYLCCKMLKGTLAVVDLPFKCSVIICTTSHSQCNVLLHKSFSRIHFFADPFHTDLECTCLSLSCTSFLCDFLCTGFVLHLLCMLFLCMCAYYSIRFHVIDAMHNIWLHEELFAIPCCNQTCISVIRQNTT